MDLPIPTTVKAKLKSLGADQTEVEVHFNPASIVYTIENSTPQQSGDPKRRQFAAQFTGKLTMDLQFDTTDTGKDVRAVTSQVAVFMQASANASKDKNSSGANPTAPPVLSFEWGAYEFKGTMDSFKETIDFFSAEGVPLRAMVSISLARQDQVFDEGADFASSDTSGSLVPTSDGDSATSAAAKGGDPSAGRQLASANGLENPRFTAGASLQVGGGLQLNAAAGFTASASIGAGIGLSAGAGLSLGASAGVGLGLSVGGGAGFGLSGGASAGVGFGLSASASAGAAFGLSAGASAGVGFGASAGMSGGVSAGGGIGVSAGVGFGASAGIGGGALFGSSASAGVPATFGAFAGLETGRVKITSVSQLDARRMVPAVTGPRAAVGVNASFSLGGAATAQSGFSSNVGANFSFNDRLVFDSD